MCQAFSFLIQNIELYFFSTGVHLTWNCQDLQKVVVLQEDGGKLNFQKLKIPGLSFLISNSDEKLCSQA